MCNKCHYQIIDGVQVHINGDASSPDVQEAIESLVKIARNYTKMKDIQKDEQSKTLAIQEKAKESKRR